MTKTSGKRTALRLAVRRDELVARPRVGVDLLAALSFVDLLFLPRHPGLGEDVRAILHGCLNWL